MKPYPVNLDLEGRRCLVVGAGEVARRKARGLLEAGARVTVIAPDAEEEPFDRLARMGELAVLRRSYSKGDCRGALLVFAATDDPAVNGRVAVDAREAGAFVCVVNDPRSGDFHVPSRVRRGELLLTISTSGQVPGLAKRLRRDLEKTFDPSYAALTRFLGAVREELVDLRIDPETNSDLIAKLIDSGVREVLEKRDAAAVEGIMKKILGEDFSLAGLDFDFEEPTS